MFAHPIDGLAEREGESLGQLRKLRNRVSGGMDSRDGIPFNAAGHKPTHILGSGSVFGCRKGTPGKCEWCSWLVSFVDSFR